jgi:dTDP-4-amino-4,6-dideoxygalactose transaminase
VSVPMVDLKAQYRSLKPELDAAVTRVLESASFIGGAECRLFEEEFAAYCGVAHGVGVANGTDALVLALRAYGVGSGDDVVTVANTFIATGEAVILNNARPVFVDVDEASATLDPRLLEKALTARTKLILPVHLYGQPADMEPILDMARRHGLPVLEDAAQAHGAAIGERRVGSFGHAACFSFYPAKNLGAYGDAGMVVSGDARFAGRIRQMANHGSGTHRYDNVVIGTNSRLDAVQAAILRVKLRHLDTWNEARRERVLAYNEALAGIDGLVLPGERPGVTPAWHLYTIRTARQEGLEKHLAAQGIATARHYPRPIHLQPALAFLAGSEGDLPVSERLCREVLQLPLYPELPMAEVQRIAAHVRAYLTS